MRKKAVGERGVRRNRKTIGQRLQVCLLAVLTGAVCFAGCGSENGSDAGESLTKMTEKQEEASEVTFTPIPESTATPIPEPTVTPTPELTATSIPEPTVTPTPEPTAIPTEAPDSTEAPVPETTEASEPADGMLSGDQEEGTLSKPDHSDTETSDKLIFVGDSRTVGMRDAVHDENAIWSCKSAMGYAWMSSVGIPQIEDEIDEYTSVIILMGVNDVNEINNYVNYINKKANDWTDLGARTYFVSVGPVENDPYVSNMEIESFNSAMEANLAGVTYIDVYSHLVSNGFSTVDGIHYPDSVSIDIYNYILDHLEETRSGIWG